MLKNNLSIKTRMIKIWLLVNLN